MVIDFENDLIIDNDNWLWFALDRSFKKTAYFYKEGNISVYQTETKHKKISPTSFCLNKK